MDIYEILGSPWEFETFLGLTIESEEYIIIIDGYIDVKIESYYNTYDGNLLSGGYDTEEIIGVHLEIDEIEIFHKDDEDFNSPIHCEKLKDRMIKELKECTEF